MDGCIASGSADGTVRVWDANTRQKTLTLFEGSDLKVRRVAWHPGRKSTGRLPRPDNKCLQRADR